MQFEDPICPVCDRPARPDDIVVKAGHDVTHLRCLPSGRTVPTGVTPGTSHIVRTKT